MAVILYKFIMQVDVHSCAVALQVTFVDMAAPILVNLPEGARFFSNLQYIENVDFLLRPYPAIRGNWEACSGISLYVIDRLTSCKPFVNYGTSSSFSSPNPKLNIFASLSSSVPPLICSHFRFRLGCNSSNFNNASSRDEG